VTCRITKMCRQIFRQYRDDAGIVPYTKKSRICTDSHTEINLQKYVDLNCAKL
jgi:hypothetical protein